MRQVTTQNRQCVKVCLTELKRVVKDGRPGQWSARKAQMLAKQYKANGGGYRD